MFSFNYIFGETGGSLFSCVGWTNVAFFFELMNKKILNHSQSDIGDYNDYCISDEFVSH
jgi:hypothetical protein